MEQTPSLPLETPYLAVKLDTSITLTPKEIRVLEIVKDSPKCQSTHIKGVLMSEGWKKYEHERSSKVSSWPHIELSKKGLMTFTSMGTKKFWDLTELGEKILSKSGTTWTEHQTYEDALSSLDSLKGKESLSHLLFAKAVQKLLSMMVRVSNPQDFRDRLAELGLDDVVIEWIRHNSPSLTQDRNTGAYYLPVPA